MKRFTITHTLLVVTWCGIAFMVLPRFLASSPYQGHTNDLDGRIVFNHPENDSAETVIDETSVAGAPQWHPLEPNPPLSARSALLIAYRFQKKHIRDTRRWRWGIDCVTLYPVNASRNQWCWGVLFTAYPKTGGMSGVPPQLEAYILMDGRLVTSDPLERMSLDDEVAEESPPQLDPFGQAVSPAGNPFE